MVVTKYRIEFHTQYEQCDLEFSEGLRRTFTSPVCSSRRPDTLKTLVPAFSSPPSSGRRRARIGAYRTATNAPKGWLAGDFDAGLRVPTPPAPRCSVGQIGRATRQLGNNSSTRASDAFPAKPTSRQMVSLTITGLLGRGRKLDTEL